MITSLDKTDKLKPVKYGHSVSLTLEGREQHTAHFKGSNEKLEWTVLNV